MFPKFETVVSLTESALQMTEMGLMGMAWEYFRKVESIVESCNLFWVNDRELVPGLEGKYRELYRRLHRIAA